MTNTRRILYLFGCVWLAACASSPTSGEPDPQIEDEARRRQAANTEVERRQEAFDVVLLNLDKTIDKYVQTVARTEIQRADKLSASLETYLRTTVAKHFDELVLAADDASNPSNQAIAAGALGLSERPEALDPLLNAARSPEPAVVTNAVFALGMLRDERTPPEVISDVLENPDMPRDTRVGAAWSLLQVQRASHTPEVVAPVWLRLLSAPDGQVDPLILVQALRGVGYLRDPALAPVVVPYLKDPLPFVRVAAATSLGLIGDPSTHEALIECLDPSETNANVRLVVRKALQALAGGADRGYDVKEWRRVFETKYDG